MSLGMQDLIVTVMALGAAAIILRRMVGAFRPGKTNPACGGCASGAAACAKGAPAHPGDKPIPLVLHRR